MNGYIKFNDVLSSANVANTFYYVKANTVDYVTTTATTVLFHIDGLDANTADDNITITCASGYSEALANQIIKQVASLRGGQIMTVDKDTGKSGTAISDISPNVV